MSYALVLVSTSAVVAITIYSGLKAVEIVKEVEANAERESGERIR